MKVITITDCVDCPLSNNNTWYDATLDAPPVSNDMDDREREFDPGGMSLIDANDIIGCTYLTTPAEDRRTMQLCVEWNPITYLFQDHGEL